MTTHTSDREVGRLARIQAQPLRYIERRVEELDLENDYHYKVRVTQQIVVPVIAGDDETAEREVLVPIGYHGKRLLPDLRVTDGGGALLPILSRADRGHVIARIFTGVWAENFLGSVSPGSAAQAESIWRSVRILVAKMSGEDRATATISFLNIRTLFRAFVRDASLNGDVRIACVSILGDQQFWNELNAIGQTRLIMASVVARPGSTVTVLSEHTERFEYDVIGGRLLSVILSWLSWTPTAVVRYVANSGRADSLWVIHSLPAGVESVRAFWRDRGNIAEDADSEVAESDRAVAGRYHELFDPDHSDYRLQVDIQVKPSPSLATAIAVSLFLLFVSTYVYQSPRDLPSEALSTNIVGIAGAFAGVPAAVAAALAYNGQVFARRVSRGPRMLVALLAAQAAFLSIVVSLERAGGLVEGSAYSLSVYCFLMVGVFGFIQFGPRWRKGIRSRRTGKTARMTPLQCRRRQLQSAVLFGAVLVLSTVAFSRVQVVLRFKHVFTHEFPANVWHAWWSWFGL